MMDAKETLELTREMTPEAVWLDKMRKLYGHLKPLMEADLEKHKGDAKQTAEIVKHYDMRVEVAAGIYAKRVGWGVDQLEVHLD